MVPEVSVDSQWFRTIRAHRNCTCMPTPARFPAEFLIEKSLTELNTYAEVFAARITSAFANLEMEANAVTDRAYSEWSTTAGPDCDPFRAQESAYFEGVGYYEAVDSVRQGLFNLILAGLFHLFEQQVITLLDREVPPPPTPPSTNNTLLRVKQTLLPLGLDITTFASYSKLDELRLVANTVKHGDGFSASELLSRAPHLFEEHIVDGSSLPLRPLFGEGLRLTEAHFSSYKNSLEAFWHELATTLVPILYPG